MGLTEDNPRPLVMGIVNVTPDSFSDGGHHATADQAIAHAHALIQAGADILDIGGESTRPGASPVSLQEEMDRVMPVIEGLCQNTSVTISIDTRRPEIAHAAIKAGVQIWNDVSALRTAPASLQTAADLNVPVVLMHMRGEPGTMQDKPQYEDVVAEVIAFLRERVQAAMAAGVRQENIIIDPGIGFGKRLKDNLALMQALGRIIEETGQRLLFGASRKRFIEGLDPGAAPDDRLGGSLASALWATQAGVHMIRVHDVKEMVQALRVWHAIKDAAP
ncbi:MAG: dihydropteroate synthase [Robiginitomaculum sp.]|nr:dihydropteroate synthase [Robiginitomaculum sp.]MDQ7078695.1 dihydropteroate synthase [Robiginitomaculum sp.]